MKEFNRNFGISPSVELERQYFINRVASYLERLREAMGADYYNRAFTFVCVHLGLNPSDVRTQHYLFRDGGNPELADIVVPKDFFTILKTVSALRLYFADDNENAQTIDKNIVGLIEMATTDLGIAYSNGQFYPKGESFLDNHLVDAILTVLSQYPNEEKDLRSALENYKAGRDSDVINKCYLCMEGVVKKILNNDRNLIANKIDLLKQTGLSDQWNKHLVAYIEFGNDYGRHANDHRHNLKDSEVEAYLYTTCVLIRLMLKAKAEVK